MINRLKYTILFFLYIIFVMSWLFFPLMIIYGYEKMEEILLTKMYYYIEQMD